MWLPCADTSSFSIDHRNYTTNVTFTETDVFNRCLEDTITGPLLAMSLFLFLPIALEVFVRPKRKTSADHLTTDLSQPVTSTAAMALYRARRAVEVALPISDTAALLAGGVSWAVVTAWSFVILNLLAFFVTLAVTFASTARTGSSGATGEARTNGGDDTWNRLIVADLASVVQWTTFTMLVLFNFIGGLLRRNSLAPSFGLRVWVIVKAVFVALRARVQLLIVLGRVVALPAALAIHSAHDNDAREADWITWARLVRAASVVALSIVALVMPGPGREASSRAGVFDPLSLLQWDAAEEKWVFSDGAFGSGGDATRTAAEDDAAIEEQRSQEASASILSYFAFGWLGGLLRAGIRAPLQLRQIFMYTGRDSPRANAEIVGASLAQRVRARGGTAGTCTLCCALQKDYFWYIWGNGALVLMGALLSLVQPQLLGMFLKQIEVRVIVSTAT